MSSLTRGVNPFLWCAKGNIPYTFRDLARDSDKKQIAITSNTEVITLIKSMLTPLEKSGMSVSDSVTTFDSVVQTARIHIIPENNSRMFQASITTVQRLNHSLSTIDVFSEAFRASSNPKLYSQVVQLLTEAALNLMDKYTNGKPTTMFATFPEANQTKITLFITQITESLLKVYPSLIITSQETDPIQIYLLLESFLTALNIASNQASLNKPVQQSHSYAPLEHEVVKNQLSVAKAKYNALLELRMNGSAPNTHYWCCLHLACSNPFPDREDLSRVYYQGLAQTMGIVLDHSSYSPYDLCGILLTKDSSFGNKTANAKKVALLDVRRKALMHSFSLRFDTRLSIEEFAKLIADRLAVGSWSEEMINETLAYCLTESNGNVNKCTSLVDIKADTTGPSRDALITAVKTLVINPNLHYSTQEYVISSHDLLSQDKPAKIKSEGEGSKFNKRFNNDTTNQTSELGSSFNGSSGQGVGQNSNGRYNYSKYHQKYDHINKDRHQQANNNDIQTQPRFQGDQRKGQFKKQKQTSGDKPASVHAISITSVEKQNPSVKQEVTISLEELESLKKAEATLKAFGQWTAQNPEVLKINMKNPRDNISSTRSLLHENAHELIKELHNSKTVTASLALSIFKQVPPKELQEYLAKNGESWLKLEMASKLPTTSLLCYKEANLNSNPLNLPVCFDSGAECNVITKDLINHPCFTKHETDQELDGIVPNASIKCNLAVSCFVPYMEEFRYIRFYVIEGKSKCLIANTSAASLGYAMTFRPNVDCHAELTATPVHVDNVADIELKVVDHENLPKAMNIIQSSLDKNANVSGLCSHPNAAYEPEWNPGVKVSNIVCPVIPIKEKHKERWNEHVKLILKNGWIEIMPEDEDGVRLFTIGIEQGIKLRFCVDSRTININMLISQADFDSVTECLQKIARKGFNYITQIDIVNAYFTLPLVTKKDERLYFVHNNTRYYYKRVPFGPKNAPQVFNKLMRDVLRGLEDFSTSFFDNIFVFTNGSVEDHAHAVKKVIDVLNKYNLPISVPKLDLLCTQIPFLGHILSRDGLKISPTKFKALTNYPCPQTRKQLLSLIGAYNFIRSFIPKAALYMKELYDCAKIVPEKGYFSKEMSEKVKTALEIAKVGVQNNVLLSLPPPASIIGHWFIISDASDGAIGGVAGYVSDGKTYFTGFFSRLLKGTELKWNTTRKELDSIRYILTNCEKLMSGHKVIVYTDHIALTSNRGVKENIKRPEISIWNYLFQYDLAFVHISGADNGIADLLSRSAAQYHKAVHEVRNYDDKHLHVHLAELRMSPEDSDLFDDTDSDDENSSQDSKMGNFKVNVKELSEAERLSKVDAQTKLDYLKLAHGSRHSNARAMYEYLLSRNVYWKNVFQNCQFFCINCTSCVMYNPVRNIFNKLRAFNGKRPFELIQMDLAGELPSDEEGFKFILVIVDSITNYCILRGLRNKTAGLIASKLVDVFNDYGHPVEVQSDNGGEFANGLMTKVYAELNTKTRFSAAYNPSQNGLAERMVGQVKSALEKRLCELKLEPQKWHTILGEIQLSINSSHSNAIKGTPFELMYGRQSTNSLIVQGIPVTHSDDEGEDKEVGQTWADTRKELTQGYDILYDFREGSKNKTNAKVDASRNTTDEIIESGTLVLIKNSDKREFGNFPFIGPYMIEKFDGANYHLRDPDTDKVISRTVPRKFIKLWTVDVPEIKASDLEEHVMEKILDHKREKGVDKFWIKWLNCPMSESTWEPASNITDQGWIDEYIKHFKENPGVPITLPI